MQLICNSDLSSLSELFHTFRLSYRSVKSRGGGPGQHQVTWPLQWGPRCPYCRCWLFHLNIYHVYDVSANLNEAFPFQTQTIMFSPQPQCFFKLKRFQLPTHVQPRQHLLMKFIHIHSDWQYGSAPYHVSACIGDGKAPEYISINFN